MYRSEQSIGHKGPYYKKGRYIMITNVTKMVVGVDVSKSFLDVCIYMPDGCNFKDKGYQSRNIFESRTPQQD